jgi:MFS family permease
VAITAVFMVHGFVFASWTAHIPQVKQHLRLTDGSLGQTLLGAPAGSVLAMMLSAYLLPRVGSRLMVRICVTGYCLAGPLVGLAHSMLALFLALFVWGAFQGSLDTAMNTQAIMVERAQDRPLMSSLHGCWSIGSFSGAALGAVGVALGVSLSAQLLAIALVALPIAGWFSLALRSDEVAESDRAAGDRHRRFSVTVVLLGGIVFAALLCEGAAADWAAVYLRGPVKASAGVAGLGYAAFSLTMVVIRLFGNRLAERFPVQRLLPVLAGLSTVGFAGGLLFPHPVTALIGFGCLALGLASIVPTLFSAAGRLPGMHPGTAVATVATFGWAGFVCGPPLIGQLSQASNLRCALALLPTLTLLIAIATATTKALRPPGVEDGRSPGPAG